MNRYRELFEQVRLRPGMFLPETSFAAAVSFVVGYDLACEGDVLRGFREWLLLRSGGNGWNLSWPGLVRKVVFPDDAVFGEPTTTPEAHRRAIDSMFALIAEFDAGVRCKPDGVDELLEAFGRIAP